MSNKDSVGKTTQGRKDDAGKTQWWYMPIKPMQEVIGVLEYGDKKYPAEDGCNWKNVPDARKRYYSALMRHITEWFEGETHDKESGRHHLAHAATNCLFLLWFDLNKQEKEHQEIIEKLTARKDNPAPELLYARNLKERVTAVKITRYPTGFIPWYQPSDLGRVFPVDSEHADYYMVITEDGSRRVMYKEHCQEV